MNEKQPKPYGSWTSPINAELVSTRGSRLGHVQVVGEQVYWLESRAQEKGRGVIVCCDGQTKSDVLPDSVSVGSKVHEYGGGDFVVAGSKVFYCDAKDQRVYCFDQTTRQAEPITEKPPEEKGWRYADFSITPDHQFLFLVRERHEESVINELVMINLAHKTTHCVAQGYDFYSYPRVSPDGDRLCWTCWNHPQMPWDGSELWVADIHTDGTVSAEHKVCGSDSESIYQPAWSPDGVLHFISDRSGYWNLYSFRDGVMNALMPTDHDCGIPQWNFATSTYCFGNDDNIYLSFFEQGEQGIAHLNTKAGHIEPVNTPLTEFAGQIHFQQPGQLVVVAGSSVIPLGLFQIPLDGEHFVSLTAEPKLPVSTDYLSLAKPIQFTSSEGYQAFGYFYEPNHPDFQGESDEKPPLIVLSHSGPTAMATTTLDWSIQYWTSRGFAVVDVNYGGSSGYGRAYRNLLRGRWGVNDVNDCVYAARFLVEDGLVDGKRLLIRGGSAGGFTTLCALTFTDDFAAGMSRYGVADLEALVSDGHKFEAHYLDTLVGAYPEQKELYHERSPINHTDELSCPMLILQGSDDKVVPPSQSQQLVKALAEKEIPHAYIEFEGEGHGFRQRHNIIRAFESELAFYRSVLSIESDEAIAEIDLQ